MMKVRSKVDKDYKLKTPLIPGLILLFVLIFGTLGYYLLWYDIKEATLLDAVYMTFITITTIGYGEIHGLNNTGRLLTIFVALTGIGSLFYLLTVFMENLFIIQLNNVRGKKKMNKKIDGLKNHYILVGYGRVGQLTAKVLFDAGIEFVVIDDDFSEHDVTDQKKHLLTIRGDATDDHTLIKSGIEKAKCIIIATANSATTVFVTLSAKVLNPEIFVVARSDEFSNIDKLYRAGADRVVNPYSIGGQRLANLAINPNVIEFFETDLGKNDERLSIENIVINSDSPFINKSLKELDLRQKTGVSILALIRESNPLINPDSSLKIQSGDQLVTFGTRKQLKSLETLSNII